MKTNFELVQILKALNGSNDVEMKFPNKERIPPDSVWTFEALQLFNSIILMFTLRRSKNLDIS